MSFLRDRHIGKLLAPLAGVGATFFLFLPYGHVTHADEHPILADPEPTTTQTTSPRRISSSGPDADVRREILQSDPDVRKLEEASLDVIRRIPEFQDLLREGKALGIEAVYLYGGASRNVVFQARRVIASGGESRPSVGTSSAKQSSSERREIASSPLGQASLAQRAPRNDTGGWLSLEDVVGPYSDIDVVIRGTEDQTFRLRKVMEQRYPGGDRFYRWEVRPMDYLRQPFQQLQGHEPISKILLGEKGFYEPAWREQHWGRSLTEQGASEILSGEISYFRNPQYQKSEQAREGTHHEILEVMRYLRFLNEVEGVRPAGKSMEHVREVLADARGNSGRLRKLLSNPTFQHRFDMNLGKLYHTTTDNDKLVRQLEDLGFTQVLTMLGMEQRILKPLPPDAERKGWKLGRGAVPPRELYHWTKNYKTAWSIARGGFYISETGKQFTGPGGETVSSVGQYGPGVYVSPNPAYYRSGQRVLVRISGSPEAREGIDWVKVTEQMYVLKTQRAIEAMSVESPSKVLEWLNRFTLGAESLPPETLSERINRLKQEKQGKTEPWVQDLFDKTIAGLEETKREKITLQELQALRERAETGTQEDQERFRIWLWERIHCPSCRGIDFVQGELWKASVQVLGGTNPEWASVVAQGVRDAKPWAADVLKEVVSLNDRSPEIGGALREQIFRALGSGDFPTSYFDSAYGGRRQQRVRLVRALDRLGDESSRFVRFLVLEATGKNGEDRAAEEEALEILGNLKRKRVLAPQEEGLRGELWSEWKALGPSGVPRLLGQLDALGFPQTQVMSGNGKRYETERKIQETLIVLEESRPEFLKALVDFHMGPEGYEPLFSRPASVGTGTLDVPTTGAERGPKLLLALLAELFGEKGRMSVDKREKPKTASEVPRIVEAWGRKYQVLESDLAETRQRLLQDFTDLARGNRHHGHHGFLVLEALHAMGERSAAFTELVVEDIRNGFFPYALRRLSGIFPDLVSSLSAERRAELRKQLVERELRKDGTWRDGFASLETIELLHWLGESRPEFLKALVRRVTWNQTGSTLKLLLDARDRFSEAQREEARSDLLRQLKERRFSRTVGPRDPIDSKGAIQLMEALLRMGDTRPEVSRLLARAIRETLANGSGWYMLQEMWDRSKGEVSADLKKSLIRELGKMKVDAQKDTFVTDMRSYLTESIHSNRAPPQAQTQALSLVADQKDPSSTSARSNASSPTPARLADLEQASLDVIRRIPELQDLFREAKSLGIPEVYLYGGASRNVVFQARRVIASEAKQSPGVRLEVASSPLGPDRVGTQRTPRNDTVGWLSLEDVVGPYSDLDVIIRGTQDQARRLQETMERRYPGGDRFYRWEVRTMEYLQEPFQQLQGHEPISKILLGEKGFYEPSWREQHWGRSLTEQGAREILSGEISYFRNPQYGKSEQAREGTHHEILEVMRFLRFLNELEEVRPTQESMQHVQDVMDGVLGRPGTIRKLLSNSSFEHRFQMNLAKLYHTPRNNMRLVQELEELGFPKVLKAVGLEDRILQPLPLSANSQWRGLLSGGSPPREVYHWTRNYKTAWSIARGGFYISETGKQFLAPNGDGAASTAQHGRGVYVSPDPNYYKEGKRVLVRMTLSPDAKEGVDWVKVSDQIYLLKTQRAVQSTSISSPTKILEWLERFAQGAESLPVDEITERILRLERDKQKELEPSIQELFDARIAKLDEVRRLKVTLQELDALREQATAETTEGQQRYRDWLWQKTKGESSARIQMELVKASVQAGETNQGWAKFVAEGIRDNKPGWGEPLVEKIRAARASGSESAVAMGQEVMEMLEQMWPKNGEDNQTWGRRDRMIRSLRGMGESSRRFVDLLVGEVMEDNAGRSEAARALGSLVKEGKLGGALRTNLADKLLAGWLASDSFKRPLDRGTEMLLALIEMGESRPEFSQGLLRQQMGSSIWYLPFVNAASKGGELYPIAPGGQERRADLVFTFLSELLNLKNGFAEPFYENRWAKELSEVPAIVKAWRNVYQISEKDLLETRQELLRHYTELRAQKKGQSNGFRILEAIHAMGERNATFADLVIEEIIGNNLFVVGRLERLLPDLVPSLTSERRAELRQEIWRIGLRSAGWGHMYDPQGTIELLYWLGEDRPEFLRALVARVTWTEMGRSPLEYLLGARDRFSPAQLAEARDNLLALFKGAHFSRSARDRDPIYDPKGVQAMEALARLGETRPKVARLIARAIREVPVSYAGWARLQEMWDRSKEEMTAQLKISLAAELRKTKVAPGKEAFLTDVRSFLQKAVAKKANTSGGEKSSSWSERLKDPLPATRVPDPSSEADGLRGTAEADKAHERRAPLQAQALALSASGPPGAAGSSPQTTAGKDAELRTLERASLEVIRRIPEFQDLFREAKALGVPEVYLYGGASRNVVFQARRVIASEAKQSPGVRLEVASSPLGPDRVGTQRTPRNDTVGWLSLEDVVGPYSDLDVIVRATPEQAERLRARMEQLYPGGDRFYRWEVRTMEYLQEPFQQLQGHEAISKMLLGEKGFYEPAWREQHWGRSLTEQGAREILSGEISYFRNPRYRESEQAREGKHHEILEVMRYLRFLYEFEDVHPTPESMRQVQNVLKESARDAGGMRKLLSDSTFSHRFDMNLIKLLHTTRHNVKLVRELRQLGFPELLDAVGKKERMLTPLPEGSEVTLGPRDAGKQLLPREVYHWTRNYKTAWSIARGGFYISEQGKQFTDAKGQSVGSSAASGPGVYVSRDPEYYKSDGRVLVRIALAPDAVEGVDWIKVNDQVYLLKTQKAIVKMTVASPTKVLERMKRFVATAEGLSPEEIGRRAVDLEQQRLQEPEPWVQELYEKTIRQLGETRRLKESLRELAELRGRAAASSELEYRYQLWSKAVSETSDRNQGVFIRMSVEAGETNPGWARFVASGLLQGKPWYQEVIETIRGAKPETVPVVRNALIEVLEGQVERKSDRDAWWGQRKIRPDPAGNRDILVRALGEMEEKSPKFVDLLTEEVVKGFGGWREAIGILGQLRRHGALGQRELPIRDQLLAKLEELRTKPVVGKAEAAPDGRILDPVRDNQEARARILRALAELGESRREYLGPLLSEISHPNTAADMFIRLREDPSLRVDVPSSGPERTPRLALALLSKIFWEGQGLWPDVVEKAPIVEIATNWKTEYQVSEADLAKVQRTFRELLGELPIPLGTARQGKSYRPILLQALTAMGDDNVKTAVLLSRETLHGNSETTARLLPTFWKMVPLVPPESLAEMRERLFQVVWEGDKRHLKGGAPGTFVAKPDKIELLYRLGELRPEFLEVLIARVTWSEEYSTAHLLADAKQRLSESQLVEIRDTLLRRLQEMKPIYTPGGVRLMETLARLGETRPQVAELMARAVKEAPVDYGNWQHLLEMWERSKNQMAPELKQAFFERLKKMGGSEKARSLVGDDWINAWPKVREALREHDSWGQRIKRVLPGNGSKRQGQDLALAAVAQGESFTAPSTSNRLRIGKDTALIVVDVQNDFIPGGALGVTEGEKVVPVLNRYIRRFEKAGAPIVFTRDWHPANHSSFKEQGGPWPRHGVQGTWGAEFHRDLRIPEGSLIISKATQPDQDAYSGFKETDLAQRLKALGVKKVFVGGLATDYCVKCTVLDALAKENGFATYFLKDASRGVDLKPGDVKQAVDEMVAAGARETSSRSVVRGTGQEPSGRQTQDSALVVREPEGAGKRRVGVFGGSFNPIHNGHLEIAEAARKALGLSEVVFVPTSQTPGKDAGLLAPGEDRTRMVELAVSGRPGFRTSDVEVKRGGVSYTVDTIRELKRRYPEGTSFYLILGSDALAGLPTWKDVRTLADQVQFGFAERAGKPPLNLRPLKSVLSDEQIGRLERHRFVMQPTEGSSSEVRRRLREGGIVSETLPSSVEGYIRERGLYGAGRSEQVVEPTARPRIAVAQIAPKLGNVEENLKKHIAFVEEASRKGANLVVFPELSLTGYQVRDGAPTVSMSAEELVELFSKRGGSLRNVDVVVGFAERTASGKPYNSLAYMEMDGQGRPTLKHVHRKIYLPTYGMFDEARYFSAGRDLSTFDTKWGRTSMIICEDAWHPSTAFILGRQKNPPALILVSADSPSRGLEQGRVVPGNVRTWQALNQDLARASRAVVVNTHRVGVEDGLVFSGGSQVIGPKGKIIARAPPFQEQLLLVDLADANIAEQLTTSNRRGRSSSVERVLEKIQTEGTTTDLEILRRHLDELTLKPSEKALLTAGLGRLEGDPALTSHFKSNASSYRPEVASRRLRVNPALVTDQLVRFLQDSVRGAGFEKAVIGLSGGIDSSLVAELAVKALGKENVIGVLLPYRTSSSDSLRDAQTLAAKLGIRTETVDISPMVDPYIDQDRSMDRVRRGNLMARERAKVLFDLSAKHKAVVLGTSNKTELFMNYGTVGGDLLPLVNPLGDLYKTQLRQVARFLGVPEEIQKKAPTADLFLGQTDEGEMGLRYKKMDAILYGLVEEGLSPEELIRRGFSAEDVSMVMKRSSAEFKRRGTIIAKLSPSTIGYEWLRPRDWSAVSLRGARPDPDLGRDRVGDEAISHRGLGQLDRWEIASSWFAPPRSARGRSPLLAMTMESVVAPVNAIPHEGFIRPATLNTDLYEAKMMAGYFEAGLENTQSSFELFTRKLPPGRRHWVAAGLEQAIDVLKNLRFQPEEIKYLKNHPDFEKVKPEFFEYLKNFRFRGDVWAVPEGTIVFPDEPVLRVRGTPMEAQIAETVLLSIFNYETAVATKASRIARASKGKPFVEGGSRQAPGPEAALLAARASYIGGALGTSNVHAARHLGIPAFGTTAHSWIQQFDSEREAFELYTKVYPKTALLVDTYDTAEGIRTAIQTAGEKVTAIRIDSGDLAEESRRARNILDEMGRPDVKIILSGGLDEYKIRDLVRGGAPFDVTLIGKELVLPSDAPGADFAYKLVSVSRDGTSIPKAKFSQGKGYYPAEKQVYRRIDSRGRFSGDIVALHSEAAPAGTVPLLVQVMKEGEVVTSFPALKEIQERVKDQLARLPAKIRNFPQRATSHRPSYPVEITSTLATLREQVREANLSKVASDASLGQEARQTQRRSLSAWSGENPIEGLMSLLEGSNSRVAKPSEGNEAQGAKTFTIETSSRGQIKLVRGDITRQSVDVVVNAANGFLFPGGGVDGAIRRAAGPEITRETDAIYRKGGEIPPGSAVVTTAGKLPAKYVIHAVGPVWKGGAENEAAALSSAYRKSLELALERGAKTIAFPSISTGIFGYPVEQASPIALETVRAFLEKNPGIEEARFVLFDERTHGAYREAARKLPAREASSDVARNRQTQDRSLGVLETDPSTSLRTSMASTGRVLAAPSARVIQGQSLTTPLEQLVARLEGRPVPRDPGWTLVLEGADKQASPRALAAGKQDTRLSRSDEVVLAQLGQRPQGVKGHVKQFGRGMGIWMAALPVADIGTSVLQGRAGDIPGQLASMAQPESLMALTMNYGSFSVAAASAQYPMTRYAARMAGRAATGATERALAMGMSKPVADLAAKKAAAQTFKSIARFAGPLGFFAGSAVADMVMSGGHLDVERWMVSGLAFLGVHAALSATVAPLLIAGLGLSATGIGATVGVPILILAGTMIAVSAIEMAYDYFKAHPEVLVNAAKWVADGFKETGEKIVGGFKKAGSLVKKGWNGLKKMKFW